MWGIIPAAGQGNRIQPLAFSKELLPVGSCVDHGQERPRAVSEYLIERMILAGANKLCFVISPHKSDIIGYYGDSVAGARIAYVVQPEPAGLCDAIFRALPFISNDEEILIGLPDTIWFPERALCSISRAQCTLLLFPVSQPQFFDSVVTRPDGAVMRIAVKEPNPESNWIWGALRMPAAVLRQLFELWTVRQQSDQYLGTILNRYIAGGGQVWGVRSGETYVDVGTLHGYREAIRTLTLRQSSQPSSPPPLDLRPRLYDLRRRATSRR
ncbi:MAG TPA: sugar phosphate nucleotidyltransferase [Candidatus Binataceae bacterium]|nr:sugar phosphate nucleotidyltransferase [Candidatus Binataceae bacterium]